MASSGTTKRIRLEQRVMPVSSEEELSIVTLREQNKKLTNNHNHRVRVEQDLRNRIEQLEEVVKKCEEKEPENQLTIVNEDLRARVEDLEYELNKSRLAEKRLADDLGRLNSEFIELRKKTLSMPNHSESIRHNSASGASIVNFHGDHTQQHNQLASATNSLDSHASGRTHGDGSGGGEKTSGNFASGEISVPNATINDSNLVLNQANTIQELNIRLNDQTELAKSRLTELEELNDKYKDALLQIDKLQYEAKCIPRETITSSAEYKTLQSHFSVLYNEATQLKTQLVETRHLIFEMKNAHLRQIERMEAEEIRIQRELRTNIIDLESCLSQTRVKVEELRRENDRLDKANETTLKLDTELKKSLQNYKIQNVQKNNDLQRLKRKIEEMKKNENHPNNDSDSKNPNHVTNNNGENLSNSVSNHSTNIIATNPTRQPNNNSSSSSLTNNSLNHHAPSMKKIADLKEIIHQLQKQLDKTKSEEEALMQDLDVTGQAYEDMQDQNHRLLQQIEEKDEANFKLMSEHLKNNALHKHLNDEKLKLEEYGKCLKLKNEELERVLERHEEDKRLHQEVNRRLEMEISTFKKLDDEKKREKLELCQQLTELNIEREKITKQLSLIQKSINDKTALLTSESFKNKRLIEELDSLKKKYDRANRMQSATTPDEVLMEEIREYKEQLTCPSCKTKPKDAVLTKCFHVFCFDCLKTRVDTRQRKCPKCNAQFGANDFHRLYLA
uniref:E3 ubiquitin protein ligase n=1 Tax=Aceria tosichella TaxID=561515 RepID=A0A6G1S4K8_9ACAR